MALLFIEMLKQHTVSIRFSSISYQIEIGKRKKINIFTIDRQSFIVMIGKVHQITYKNYFQDVCILIRLSEYLLGIFQEMQDKENK